MVSMYFTCFQTYKDAVNATSLTHNFNNHEVK